MAQELKEVEYPNCFGSYYRKETVDAVLAEKDAEISELKQKLENVQASMYADVVDANMTIRRLERAVWVARELRAWCEVQFWFVNPSNTQRDVYHLACTNRIHRTPVEWMAYWQKVKHLCRQKAEEYR